MHQTPKCKCFSTRLAVVFAQYIEVKCSVENEDEANYIWAINNFIANSSASYIRDLKFRFLGPLGSQAKFHQSHNGFSGGLGPQGLGPRWQLITNVSKLSSK